jgi:hypothetical protein
VKKNKRISYEDLESAIANVLIKACVYGYLLHKDSPLCKQKDAQLGGLNKTAMKIIKRHLRDIKKNG